MLELFRQRGVPMELRGADRLIAACASGDAAAVREIVAQEPALVRQVVAYGGHLLAAFAVTGNAEGVGHLIDLGIDAGTVFMEGNGYWDVAKNSTALHIAAWRAHPATVTLLVARGAPVDAVDGMGRTPLALAVRACVDSYWTSRRTPASVETLLTAGASVRGIAYPSGYAEVDTLLAAARDMQGQRRP